MNKKYLNAPAGISSASVAKLDHEVASNGTNNRCSSKDMCCTECAFIRHHGNNRRLTEVSNEIIIFKYSSSWN